VGVRLRCRAQYEPLPVGLQQVDEAGVDRARVGEEADDAVENLFEVQRRADRRDDLVQEALFDLVDGAPRDPPSVRIARRFG
jgi:hypothetical protein